MPPASLSTLAVMNPGPTTARNTSNRPRRLFLAEVVMGAAHYRLCRSMAITSSAVMMPASRPCSSTTASVSRFYLSNRSATSSSGVSDRHDTASSASVASGVDGEAMAMRTSGTAPASFWPSPVR